MENIGLEDTPAPIHRRGRYWVQREIEKMLTLVLDGKLERQVMLCTARTNLWAFRQIARSLTAVGFPRSAAQVRSKLKIMRQNFYRTIIIFGEDPDESRMTPYFRQLKKVWEAAGRPPATSAFPMGTGPVSPQICASMSHGNTSDTSPGITEAECLNDELPQLQENITHAQCASRGEIESILKVQQDLALRVAALENMMLIND